MDVLRLDERKRHLHDDGSIRSIWLAAEDAVLMLEHADDAEPSPSCASMEMIAFAVSAADRDALRVRLAGASIAIEAETGYTTYFRDPDGRRVGVSTYDFGP